MALNFEASIYKNVIKTIKISGSFTRQSFSRIGERFSNELNEPDYKLVVLNLEDLTVLTDFAIIKLLQFKRVVKQNKGELILKNLSSRALQVLKESKNDKKFEIVYKDDLINFYEKHFGKIDVEKALQSRKHLKKDFLKLHLEITKCLHLLKLGEQGKSLKSSDEFNPSIGVVTNSIIQGKLFKKTFAKRNIEAEVMKIEEIQKILNKNINIVAWIILQEAIEKIKICDIYNYFELIRNYEMMNKLVVAPILLLNVQLEFDEEAEKTFKALDINIMQLEVISKKGEIANEILLFLKNRKSLQFYLSFYVFLKITSKDILIKFSSKIVEKDLELLKKFIYSDSIFQWMKKLILINVEVKTIKNVSEKYYSLIKEIYLRFNKRILIYISKRNQEIIGKLKTLIDENNIIVQ